MGGDAGVRRRAIESAISASSGSMAHAHEHALQQLVERKRQLQLDGEHRQRVQSP